MRNTDTLPAVLTALRTLAKDDPALAEKISDGLMDVGMSAEMEMEEGENLRANRLRRKGANLLIDIFS